MDVMGFFNPSGSNSRTMFQRRNLLPPTIFYFILIPTIAAREVNNYPEENGISTHEEPMEATPRPGQRISPHSHPRQDSAERSIQILKNGAEILLDRFGPDPRAWFKPMEYFAYMFNMRTRKTNERTRGHKPETKR